MQNREARLHKRLKHNGYPGDFIPKPRRMRWATYDKLIDELREIEREMLMRFMRRIL